MIFMKKIFIMNINLLFLSAISLYAGNEKAISIDADVCVYCATPAGIMAAIAVKKAGKSVVIIEPGRWVGGILGAGLKPKQDCPDIEATGGMTRAYINKLGGAPESTRRKFLDLLKKYSVKVIYEHRLSRCKLEKNKIVEAFFDLAPFDEFGCPPETAKIAENCCVKAKMFIDASYEGDLIYYAKVSFRTGRESSAEFDEKLAGVQKMTQLTPVDPFVKPGHPESGLLKYVDNDHVKALGSADKYTQAYNYRFYVTADPEKKAPFGIPDNYNPKDYELVGRVVENMVAKYGLSKRREKNLFHHLSWIFPGWKNSGEYNYQRRLLTSIAPVGISYRYAATSDWKIKAKIWKEHKEYLQGLHHFMSTDPRVPEKFRKITAALGLEKYHHPDTHGWPHQLYIRVSRRLRGRYTITSHDVYNETKIDDPVCLAQYGIDVYPVRRTWVKKDGKYYTSLEGKMWIGGTKGPTNNPYPISYRAITPLKKECTNLLVPVCFSATHLGYASARMEPVFMMCGESAGIAVVQALNENVAVQDINMEQYTKALKKAGQLLIWKKSTT